MNLIQRWFFIVFLKLAKKIFKTAIVIGDPDTDELMGVAFTNNDLVADQIVSLGYWDYTRLTRK